MDSCSGQSENTKTAIKTGVLSSAVEGYHGELEIIVTIGPGSAIESAEAAPGYHETEGVGTKAIERMALAIVELQSLGVDTVTGATVTSKVEISLPVSTYAISTENTQDTGTDI